MNNSNPQAINVLASLAHNATARRVDTPFLVDGAQIDFLAYSIENTNYIGIRDLAFTLSGSPKQFRVTWNSAQNAIHLTSGQPYNPVGGEMTGTGVAEAAATRVNSTVILDGNHANVAIYRVEGANFYKLRDLGRVLDFSVQWDGQRRAVVIDTSQPHRGGGCTGSQVPEPEPPETNDRDIDPAGSMVALTFDDGPSQHTTTILNTLEQSSNIATFYFLGNRLAQNRSIVQRAFNMGCETGNHTWSHPDLTRQSESRIRTEIQDTNGAIASMVGVAPATFRPPFGAVNTTVRNVSASLGLPIVLWSVDPRDWESRNADRIFNSIMGTVRDRDIILCHDIFAPTAEAMRRVIPALISRGHQLVTVTELMRHSGVTLQPGVVYRSGR